MPEPTDMPGEPSETIIAGQLFKQLVSMEADLHASIQRVAFQRELYEETLNRITWFKQSLLGSRRTPSQPTATVEKAPAQHSAPGTQHSIIPPNHRRAEQRKAAANDERQKAKGKEQKDAPQPTQHSPKQRATRSTQPAPPDPDLSQADAVSPADIEIDPAELSSRHVSFDQILNGSAVKTLIQGGDGTQWVMLDHESRAHGDLYVLRQAVSAADHAQPFETIRQRLDRTPKGRRPPLIGVAVKDAQGELYVLGPEAFRVMVER